MQLGCLIVYNLLILNFYVQQVRVNQQPHIEQVAPEQDQLLLKRRLILRLPLALEELEIHLHHYKIYQKIIY
jgi:hypothetical protein